jgi:hypothetical protein
MAHGYVLNTARRRNGSAHRAVTMVNPRPRANTSGWRHARVVSEERSSGPSTRRSSSQIHKGRVVQNEAGKKRNPAAKPKRNTTRTAKAKVVGSKAPSRRGAPKKNTSGSSITRKRSQSRTAAGKKARVATAKKRPGYTWRKGHTRNDGTRVKGGWVKNAMKAKRSTARKPKRNTTVAPRKNAAPRRKVLRNGSKRKIRKNQGFVVTPTGRKTVPVGAAGVSSPSGRRTRARAMSPSDAARFEQRVKAQRKAAAAKRTPTNGRATTSPRPSTASRPATKAPAGKVWRRAYTRADGTKVPGTWVKKIKKGQRRYRVRDYTKKSGKQVKSYLRRRPGLKRKSAARAKSKPGHVWVKGYTRSDDVKVKGHWAKKSKPSRKRGNVRVKSYLRAVPGRKSRKRVKAYTRKAPKSSVRVKSYLRAVPGRKSRKRVKAYTRKAPKKRAIRRNPPRRPNKKAVWVKGYKRSDGVRVKGHYMTPSTGKKRKSTATKRKAAPKRRRATRVKSYLRSVPGRRNRTRVRSYTRALPPKRRAVSKSSKRSSSRKTGQIVRVKPYTRSDGVRVKGYSYRSKKGGRKTGTVRRNPYKRSKVSVGSYLRKQPGRANRRRVKGYSRSQWYPHRSGSRWISQASASRMGLLTQREKRALAKRMRRNPSSNPSSMMALLPAREQLMMVGKKVGVGAVGFGGAVAMGVALNRVTMLTQYLGSWTPVLGNVAAGLGFWAVASAMDHEGLKEMRVPVAVGAGLAAVVNIANQLVARNTIPAHIASWVLPGSGAVAAAPTEAVEPTINGGNGAMLTNGNGAAMAPANGNGNGTSGFGQIDVYEAALDGMGGIEEELEMEMSRMSGMGDGVFDTSPDGIFDGMGAHGEYLSVPMNGMGAMVEEAFAGGQGEYLEVPMGEYLQVPMGATVEEAYAGMGQGTQVEAAYAGGRGVGEYLEVPMGEYLQVPMGAMVEEAYAGMGSENGNGATAEQVEQSLRNHPLMPGFRQAVQQMVRKRIAEGQPLDEAFYGQVGRAAASLARKKFDQRVRLASGKPHDIVTEPWKAPLLRSSAPMYKRNISDPSMVPGIAEPIAARGPVGNHGIFSEEDDDGIF